MPLIPSPWTVGTGAGAAAAAVVIAVCAYFLGCFNGAVIVSKYILRNDVRQHGSGNAGLTNFYRVFGGGLTAVVVLCDVVKMILAIWLGVQLFHFVSWPGLELYGKYWAGCWCLIGHAYPCMFRFRGGKGVLSGGTMALMIDWRVALVVWGGFIVLAVLTRWVSLGSIWAGFTFPIASGLVFRDWIIFVLAAVCGGLLLWKHRGNMKRILQGTESKFTLHKKKTDPPGGEKKE